MTYGVELGNGKGKTYSNLPMGGLCGTKSVLSALHGVELGEGGTKILFIVLVCGEVCWRGTETALAMFHECPGDQNSSTLSRMKGRCCGTQSAMSSFYVEGWWCGLKPLKLCSIAWCRGRERKSHSNSPMGGLGGRTKTTQAVSHGLVARGRGDQNSLCVLPWKSAGAGPNLLRLCFMECVGETGD